jgi:exosortase B
MGIWLKWIPVMLGLLILYVPSYMDLAKGFWKSEVGAHGPIILAVALWLMWRQRDALNDDTDVRMPAWGAALIALGLLMYVLGRSQEFFQFEVGSQIPLLCGIVLALAGRRAMRRLWFPIFFLCFLVPIPASLLDAITLPLKKYVSIVVENLLYGAGYPVARTGVVLTIGAYQVLIANACSGLNSMVALSAVGVLFVYLMGHKSRLHNFLLLASVLPIAFLANIVRVTGLMLVTYYFGDSAGHSFHDTAGYLEIVFAFAAFFALDALINLFGRRGRAGPPAAASVNPS